MNYNHTYRRDPIVEPSQLYAANDIYHATTDQNYMLGCKLELADGRIFRYCKCGTGVTKALMTQQATVNSDWDNEVQTTGTAAVIGDQSIKVYVVNAPSAHDWDDGWLNVRDGTGEGEAYLIKSHDASLLPVIELADEGGIRTATLASTGTELTIIKNLYRDIVVHPSTTATGMPTGVPLCTIATASYGWLQTHGLCPMIVDGGDTVTVGLDVGVGDTDDGHCKERQSTGPAWGIATTAVGEADGTALIFLTLE